MNVKIEFVLSDGFGLGSIGLHNNQKQQQQPKEEKHVESKSYLDSDISSIFSNRKTCTIFHSGTSGR